MANVNITLTLNDAQQAAIRLVRDRIRPEVSDAQLIPVIQGWAMEGIKMRLFTAVDAVIDQEYQDAAAADKAPLEQAIDSNFPTP